MALNHSASLGAANMRCRRQAKPITHQRWAKELWLTARLFGVAISRVERITPHRQPQLWSAPFPVFVAVVLIAFAAATRYAGVSAASGRARRRSVMRFLTLFEMLAILPGRTGAAERSVSGFLFGIIDPADSPGWWYSA